MNNPKLPCIGIWNATQTSLPTAGNTLVGLWQGDQRIEFFCAFYWDGGKCVDPDEEGWDRVSYHSRQGDATFWDEEIEGPDFWAECRFMIPDWR